METDRERAHLAWRRADRIRNLSARVIGVGPWGQGIDGVRKDRLAAERPELLGQIATHPVTRASSDDEGGHFFHFNSTRSS